MISIIYEVEHSLVIFKCSYVGREVEAKYEVIFFIPKNILNLSNVDALRLRLILESLQVSGSKFEVIVTRVGQSMFNLESPILSINWNLRYL